VRNKKPVTAPPPAPARLFGVSQAAAYMGTTVWKIRTLFWEQKLRGVRLGHRLLFDRSDLDACIERIKDAA